MDAMLRFSHEALLQGHQDEIIFSSFLISDRIELSNKPNIDTIYNIDVLNMY